MPQQLLSVWVECLKTEKSFFLSFILLDKKCFLSRVEMQSRCGARCCAGWARAQHKLVLFLFCAPLFQLMLSYGNVCLITLHKKSLLSVDLWRKLTRSRIDWRTWVRRTQEPSGGQPFVQSLFFSVLCYEISNFITVQKVKWARHSYNQPPR